jgi:IS30 family transposase
VTAPTGHLKPIAGPWCAEHVAHPRRVETNRELGDVVAELLAQRWSPAQIARHLRRQFPDDRWMWLCHGSIYQAVYQTGSLIIWPLKVVSLQGGPLRTGRDRRKAQQRRNRRRPRFAQPVLSVHQRPSNPATAARPAIGNLNGVVKPSEPGVGVPRSMSGSRAAVPIRRRCGGGPAR